MDMYIITTTPTIEGHPINAYLGAINVNVVIGTNFFSGFAASFTDVLTEEQKIRKIGNMLSALKKQGVIKLTEKKKWVLVEV